MWFSYSFIGARASHIAGAEVINGARAAITSTLFTLPISFKEAEEETEEPLRRPLVTNELRAREGGSGPSVKRAKSSLIAMKTKRACFP